MRPVVRSSPGSRTSMRMGEVGVGSWAWVRTWGVLVDVGRVDREVGGGYFFKGVDFTWCF